MVDTVEELPHVAFERIACARIVAALRAEHIAHRLHTLVCAFPHLARKRSRYECRLEDRIENVKDRMVQHSVAHRRFVYPAAFGVMDPESVIQTMPVDLVAQIAMQLKDMPFDILLELGHVRLVALIAFERAPCGKKIFRRDDAPIYVFVDFHMYE